MTINQQLTVGVFIGDKEIQIPIQINIGCCGTGIVKSLKINKGMFLLVNFFKGCLTSVQKKHIRANCIYPDVQVSIIV